MKEVTVDISCPKCDQKAVFHSTYTGTYKLYPDKNGKISCLHCGFNGPYIFTAKDYYYQIPVGKRTLYAMSKENLILLKNYFETGYKNKSTETPEVDFPKEFYLRRNDIVKKINSILEKENGSCS